MSKRDGSVQASGRDSEGVQSTGQGSGAVQTSAQGPGAAPISGQGSAAIPTSGQPLQLNSALRQYIEGQRLSPHLDADAPDVRREELRKSRLLGTFSNVLQGYWLAQIKAIDGKAAFVEAYTSLDIGRSEAFRRIAQFGLFNAFDDLEVVEALAAIDPNKITELQLDHDQWLDLARGNQVLGMTLDDVAETPVMALRERRREQKHEQTQELEEERQKRIDYQQRFETANTQLRKLTEAPGQQLPSEFAAMRDQCTFMTSRMFEEAALLSSLAAEKLIKADWRESDEAEHLQAVATTLYHSLNGTAATIARLLDDIKLCFGDNVCSGVQPHLQYPAKLAERVHALREQALTAAQEDFQNVKKETRKKHHVRGRHS